MTDESLTAQHRGGVLQRRFGTKAAAIRAAFAHRVALPAGPPWAFVALGAFAVVLIAWLALDEGSVAWAQDLPQWLEDFAQIMSEVGLSQWYLVPTGVLAILLFLGDWTRLRASLVRGWATVGALTTYAFLAVGLGGIAVNLLKIVFGRARPHLFDEAGVRAFDFWAAGYDNASFPSGHATTAGSLIVVGWFLFPRLRPLVVLFGLAIAGSRVVVGAHYPSDVAAGLVVGGTVAYLVARLFARHGLGFTAHPMRRDGAPIRAAVRDNGILRFLVAPIRALIG
ncbi:MAG: phosphatase PAP2 family protein [Bauldia sp.]